MQKQQLKCIGAGEDSQLLVLDLPCEVIADDAPSSCIAIPILSRDGGVLLGIPTSYILPHALLEAVSSDDTGLLGPSKEIKAFLLEEDEDGNEQQLEFDSSFLAVDFSNEVLSMLRPYDPVTDPSHAIQPFDAVHVEAIVDIKAAYQEVQTWLESLTPGSRENFLSAREEPSTPKVGAKKAPQKRITAAALAVQVEALSAQLQLMAQQQKDFLELQAKASSHATPAREQQPGPHHAPRLPDVSAGLRATPKMTAAKAAVAVGPPPKTKVVIPDVPGPVVPDTGETLENLEVVDPMTRAIMQQSL